MVVASVNYCDMIRNELRPASCTNQIGWLSQMFCYMIMQAVTRHTSPSTPFSHCIAKFSTSAHSPDQASSDFHLFGHLKRTLNCGRFADDDEVKEEVHDRLRHKPKTLFNSIMKLCGREKSTERAFRTALWSIPFLIQWVPERTSWS